MIDISGVISKALESDMRKRDVCLENHITDKTKTAISDCGKASLLTDTREFYSMKAEVVGNDISVTYVMSSRDSTLPRDLISAMSGGEHTSTAVNRYGNTEVSFLYRNALT